MWPFGKKKQDHGATDVKATPAMGEKKACREHFKANETVRTERDKLTQLLRELQAD